jgi:hypothetical protein
MATRLDLMEVAVEETGRRAVELGWYGSLTGAAISVAMFRYHKMPIYMVGGIGAGCGMAFVEGNTKLAKQLEPKYFKVEQ